MSSGTSEASQQLYSLGTQMESNTPSKKNDNSDHRWFTSNNGAIWVIVALFVGVGFRGYFLAQPMRYDESYTFLNFVNRDLKSLFFYPLPNNHVLHSILTRGSTLVFGQNPVAIRLIAFLAGIALIPLTYNLCRRLGQSGVFASIATAVLPYFVLYSTNARGYTLLVLFSLTLALIGTRITAQPSLYRTSLFSLIAALGMLTMPSMLFPIAGIYSWILILLCAKGYNKSILYLFAVPSILITGLLTALFYTPVILVSNGIDSIVANRFVKAQPWPEFSGQIFPHVQQTFSHFTRDVPAILLLVTIILVVIGISSAVKKQNWPVILILPSLILTSATILIIKQKIPFDRTWIFIIPFFILVADTGFTYVTSIVSGKVQYFLKIATFSVSIFIAISAMSKNAISSYQDTGTFVEAEIVAKYLKPIMSKKDLIYARVPADWPLNFYLWYHNVPQINENETPDSRRKYYVVQKSKYAIAKMSNKPHISLLNIGDLTLYRSAETDVH